MAELFESLDDVDISILDRSYEAVRMFAYYTDLDGNDLPNKNAYEYVVMTGLGDGGGTGARLYRDYSLE